MKFIFLLVMSVTGFAALAQNKSFKVGEEVEYFDGIDWIDSKVVEVDAQGRCLVILNHDPSKTKWFPASELNSLYQPGVTIVKAEVEETNKVTGIKFHVGDQVQYNNGKEWITTEVLEVGPEYTYKIFTDSSRMSIIVLAEAELKLVHSNFKEEDVTKLNNTNKLTFVLNEEVECYFEDNWKKGVIRQITEANQFLIDFGQGQSVMANQTSIRKSVASNAKSTRKATYAPGDVVLYYNGRDWVESPVIEINANRQLQVYFDANQTATTWIDPKDVY